MKKIGKNILLMIIGGIIFSVVSVYAAISMSASDISLSSTKTAKTNVSEALDELYENVGKCPSGKECYAAGTLATAQAACPSGKECYATGTLATAQAACPSGKECYATGTLAASTTAYYAIGYYTTSTFPKTTTSNTSFKSSNKVYGRLKGGVLAACFKDMCVDFTSSEAVFMAFKGYVLSKYANSPSNTLTNCLKGNDCSSLGLEYDSTSVSITLGGNGCAFYSTSMQCS